MIQSGAGLTGTSWGDRWCVCACMQVCVCVHRVLRDRASRCVGHKAGTARVPRAFWCSPELPLT